MSILSQFKQSQNTDFPNVRPSLDLRFALAKKLDPRITFTRGSTGTYFGSDGIMRTAGVNEPRFDHDPITGQSLGLLVEESRSNQLRYSEDFSVTGISNWDTGQATTSRLSNIVVSPDGNTTADKLVEGTSTNSGYTFYQPNSISGTGNICFSCFFKPAGRRYVEVNIWDGNTIAAGAVFDIQTGTYISSGATGGGSISVSSYGIIPYPNGWYRCYLVANRSSITYIYSRIVIRNNTIQANYAGDGTSGIYLWGAQLEAGAFPTSYIPTVASTVTRSADLAQMTGTNFSSWYNQSEGSLFVVASPSTNGAYSGFIYLLGTDFNNGITYLRQSDYQPVFRIRSGQRDEYSKAINGAVGFGQIWRNAVALKSAISFKTNDFNSFVSGVPITGSRATAGTLPTFTGPLYLGGLNGSTYLNGTISRLTYYPIALTQNQMVNLTS
jgi:hypothetical protein